MTKNINNFSLLLVAASTISACDMNGSSQASDMLPRHGYDLCVRGITRTDSGTLRFCEQITDATLAEFEEKLLPTDTEVILTSGGGFPESSMQFGKILQERSIRVRVRQFCLSACATYVLPAAQTINIEPYTIIAFHHTSAFIIDALADNVRAATDHPSRRPAEREREYYASLGLDSDLLYTIPQSVEPYCIGYARQNGQRFGIVKYRYEWSVPTFEQFQEFARGEVSGYWPRSRNEVEAILSPTLGLRPVSVRYGWIGMNGGTRNTRAPQLPACAPN